MLSSDEFSLAEFGLNADGETWADNGTIPEWNVMPESLPQTQRQIQWSQYNQQSCMWPATAAAQTASPVYQPTFNQTPSSAIPVMHMIRQNYQVLQNGLYPTMNHTPAQYQQIPVNQPVSHMNPQFLNRGPAIHHRAQITLVHNSNGPAKAIIKRKRKRTAFTTEQVLALEKVFSQKPYVNRDERQALVEQLQVSDRAVKVWFQNRRIKSKREEIEALSSSDHSPMSATESSDSNGLAYVEAQMSQKTDEFGYVTLDARAIGELVSVIDGLVGENVTCNVLNKEVVENRPNIPCYEPVSPAANSDCSDTSEEDAAKWRPPEPEESLRQLLDMHHFY